MAYKVIILYRLYMPSYFLGTFTEYPYLEQGRVFLLWLGYYCFLCLYPPDFTVCSGIRPTIGNTRYCPFPNRFG